MRFISLATLSVRAEAIRARPEEYSQTFPVNFAEFLLRIFTRDRRYSLFSIQGNALTIFCSLFGLVQAGFRAVRQQCQKSSSELGTKTPLKHDNIVDLAVTESGGSGSDVLIPDGNRFTSVPPTFDATSSPKGKCRRNNTSMTSSVGSPVMNRGLVPGITAGKRSRELDGQNEMEWNSDGQGKRLRKE